MNLTKHKVFISYHHANDQWYKNELLRLNSLHNIFIDGSVDTGDIDERLDNETIRQIIRDYYLKDSTVTILLVGTETKNRKHIDWELKSSMINGSVNKKSGILVINLPSTGCTYYTATHSREKEIIYPENKSWTSIDTRAEYERRYPYLPARIIDNLLKPEAKISVVNWNELNIEKLRFLIHATFEDKGNCEYDLSRTMKRNNS
ncbi:TIR domain-containing protein [Aureibaculum conchae]|uniref:TIR domain-containing protein n=1 Tax=Aureibaculum sp. 2308TA14-22 TaxID=3108392 RepID=UPI0033966E39